MFKVIYIEAPKTWPDELNQFLNKNKELIAGWECNDLKTTSALQFDQMIYAMRDILRGYSLHGYHCTKLTEDEIMHIQAHGMSLQDKQSLCARIDTLLDKELISHEIALRLKIENQADDDNRAKMLWFCFYEPFIAGEGGIERFFRSWGGEALYNSHEGTPETGLALLEIGTPCIVEAIVPMANIDNSFLPSREIYREFLKSIGYQINEPTECEAYSQVGIASNNIIGIVKYPDERFVQLTKCNEWHDQIE